MAKRGLRSVQFARAVRQLGPNETPEANEERYRAQMSELMSELVTRIEQLEADLADARKRLDNGGL